MPRMPKYLKEELNIYTHVLDNKMEEEIKKFGVAKTQAPKSY